LHDLEGGGERGGGVGGELGRAFDLKVHRHQRLFGDDVPVPPVAVEDTEERDVVLAAHWADGTGAVLVGLADR